MPLLKLGDIGFEGLGDGDDPHRGASHDGQVILVAGVHADLVEAQGQLQITS